jgi:hypothetical protein
MDIDKESRFGFDGFIADDTFSYRAEGIIIPHGEWKMYGGAWL